MDRNEYITVKAYPDDLQAAVQAKLDEGYLPLGGPGFYKESLELGLKRNWAVQAMYKCPPEPPQPPPPTKEEFIQMAAEDFMRGQSGLGEVVEEKPFVGKDGLLDESKLIGLSS